MILFALTLLGVFANDPANLQQECPGEWIYGLPNEHNMQADVDQSDRRNLIVMGQEATPHEYPYQVKVQTSNWWLNRFSPPGTNYVNNCGGSIIGKQWILSAAHCFYNKTDNLWTGTTKVIAGLNEKAIKGDFFLHADYDPETLDNDIALVKLKTALPCDNEKIRPVYLLDKSNGFDLNGCSAWATGFGHLFEEGVSGQHRFDNYEVQTRIWDTDHCNKAKENVFKNLPQTKLCGFTPSNLNEDTCQGDSGGPFVIDIDTNVDKHQYVQAGVVSYGYGCGRSAGIFADVSEYKQWIKERFPGAQFYQPNTCDKNHYHEGMIKCDSDGNCALQLPNCQAGASSWVSTGGRTCDQYSRKHLKCFVDRNKAGVHAYEICHQCQQCVGVAGENEDWEGDNNNHGGNRNSVPKKELDCCNSIAVTGLRRFTSLMGVYTKTDKFEDGYAVWENSDNGNVLYWNTPEKDWHIGPSTEAYGITSADDYVQCPDEVVKWQTGDNDIQSQASVTCVEDYKCCDKIDISGFPDGKQTDRDGIFSKVDGVMSAHLPVYQNADGQYLYFWDAYSDWRIGSDWTKDSAGVESNGNQKACPTDTTGWSLWYDGTWNSVDVSLTCVTVALPDLGCGPGKPGPSGCDQQCGSTKTQDQCGECGGDNSSCADCAGIPNGDTVKDECGKCGGDGKPEGKCDCDGNVDVGCGCGKICVELGGWTQDWTCQTNRGWQLLIEESDTFERFKGEFPDDDRASECLAACRETDKECCRINYDWTPARCHAGMISNEVPHPSHFAHPLARDTPLTTVITTPWIRLAEDGQTCDSENLEPIADASECLEAIEALNGIAPEGVVQSQKKIKPEDISDYWDEMAFGCSTSCVWDEWDWYFCQKFNTLKHKRNKAVDSSKELFIYCRASSPSETAIGKITYTAQETAGPQTLDVVVKGFAVIGVLFTLIWAYKFCFSRKQQYTEVEAGAEEL